MTSLAKALTLIRTIAQIGVGNILAVSLYRMRVKAGLFFLAKPRTVRAATLLRDVPIAPLAPFPELARLRVEADGICAGKIRVFGNATVNVSDPPDWLQSVISGEQSSAEHPWWRTKVGPKNDIKGVWELSRFDWLLVLARAARATGDRAYTMLCEKWIQNWIAHNPECRGPNWICGQETSIRLMQTLLAVRLLHQDRTPTPWMVEFARMHIARIAQTRWYADAQDNNHATSEAFAMFAGGGWLASVSGGSQATAAQAWNKIGRSWLERAVQRLVFEDGGFSQYSVNYHRVLLQTLSHAEIWRRNLALPPFSAQFYKRAKNATRWLAALVNTHSGDAPNLGSNDGANILRLDSCDYRDYRPCVQLACNIFLNASAFSNGAWNEPLMYLEMTPAAVDSQLSVKVTRDFPDFGLTLLNPRPDGAGAYAFIRVPRDRFRPLQADPLHFDLWSEDGLNLLRDAGTYSYADLDAVRYFSGIVAHNTVTFDRRDPMPRLSRFLFGDWINGWRVQPQLQDETLAWSGGYRDRKGASHCRTVRASAGVWVIEDDIEGFSNSATLHWRFVPISPFHFKQNIFENDRFKLSIDGAGGACKQLNVPESGTYNEKSFCPGVAFAVLPQTARIGTRIIIK